MPTTWKAYGSGDTGGTVVTSTNDYWPPFFGLGHWTAYAGLSWCKYLYTLTREFFDYKSGTPYGGQLYPNGSNSNPSNGQNVPF
jgi:hypothetical protein